MESKDKAPAIQEMFREHLTDVVVTVRRRECEPGSTSHKVVIESFDARHKFRIMAYCTEFAMIENP